MRTPTTIIMRFLFCFESYPVTTLFSAINSTATTVVIDGTGRGISDGDTLFIGDEEMTITDVAASRRNTVGTVLTDLTVTRGANSTTAAAHSSDDTVRAVLNSDRLRNLVFFRGANTNAPNPIRVLGYKRPLEVI